jgi:hypothetical protein
MPVAPLAPFGKERMVHNSRFWHPGEKQHPPLSKLSSGDVPPGVEAFPMLFLRSATLPKVVEWLPVPSSAVRAGTVANAVTFLPTALCRGTHTLFSCSRYYTSILFNRQKAVIRGLKPRIRLTPWVETTEARRAG